MRALATTDGHRTWLLVTAIVVGAFGPVFSLATQEASAEPARWSLDLLALPLDGAQSFEAPTTRFLAALTGGFLFGWGVTIWALRAWVFDLAPEAVRRTVLSGLIAWFVLDSAGSIAAGAGSNVAFNLIVLLVCVGPMWLPARAHDQA